MPHARIIRNVDFARYDPDFPNGPTEIIKFIAQSLEEEEGSVELLLSADKPLSAYALDVELVVEMDKHWSEVQLARAASTIYYCLVSLPQFTHHRHRKVGVWVRCPTGGYFFDFKKAQEALDAMKPRA